MSGRILVGCHEGVYVIRFEGDVRVTVCGSFDRYLDHMLTDPDFQSVLVDLSNAVAIDSTSLGVLAKLSIGVRKRIDKIPALVCTSTDIERILLNMGFDDVFAIVNEDLRASQPLAELPISTDIGEAAMRERVIEAHRVLMAMNENNRDTFKDLVEALERESNGAPSQRRVGSDP